MPEPASPSTVPEPTTFKATERRQRHQPGVDLKFSKKEDHFTAMSLALLRDVPERDFTDGADDLDDSRINAKRRGVFGRVAARLILATLILYRHWRLRLFNRKH